MLIYLFFGLVLFLGGLRFMSDALESMYGSAFSLALQRLTGNRWSAFICGCLFTVLTQSSSLASVVVVGVVNAGMLSLQSAIAIIIGANVGTTITGQLLSFEIYEYALEITIFGLFLMLLARDRKKQAGRAITGLGLMLYGLRAMGLALVPISEMAWVSSLLQQAAIHPITGIFAGAAVAAVIQSSSAVVGIVVSLAKEGVVTLASGAGIMVGADVGTCVTSLIAGLGTKKAARQAALAHLMFNVVSVVLIIPLFNPFIYVASLTSTDLPRQLANAHTLYNLSGAILIMVFLTPFRQIIEKVSMWKMK